MTTNHKEVLDSALIRPGRIDLCLELSKCDHSMIRELALRFFNLKELDAEQKNILKKIPERQYTPALIMNTFRHFKNDLTCALKKILYECEKEEGLDLDSPTKRMMNRLSNKLTDTNKRITDKRAEPKTMSSDAEKLEDPGIFLKNHKLKERFSPNEDVLVQ